MSFSALTAAPAPPSTLRPGSDLARELSALVDEIQQTREWFNAQIEGQLASLRRLRSAVQGAAAAGESCHASLSTLFEAPHPVVDMDAAATEADSSPTPLAVALANAFAPAETAFTPAAPGAATAPPEAVVLPPTHLAMLDPELEQATLRELNDALAKAFAEISARGGMLR